MVVREVSLHCIEELLIGLSCELRPALAVGDSLMPFADRSHCVWSLPCSLASRCPAERVDGWPRSTADTM